MRIGEASKGNRHPEQPNRERASKKNTHRDRNCSSHRQQIDHGRRCTTTTPAKTASKSDRRKGLAPILTTKREENPTKTAEPHTKRPKLTHSRRTRHEQRKPAPQKITAKRQTERHTTRQQTRKTRIGSSLIARGVTPPAARRWLCHIRSWIFCPP